MAWPLEGPNYFTRSFSTRVTGKSYLDVLRANIRNGWFLHDGACARCSCAEKGWWTIGRPRPVEWPPLSPDLTLFCLWGQLKATVYPATKWAVSSIFKSVLSFHAARSYLRYLTAEMFASLRCREWWTYWACFITYMPELLILLMVPDLWDILYSYCSPVYVDGSV
jgi:hypothetical protein